MSNIDCTLGLSNSRCLRITLKHSAYSVLFTSSQDTTDPQPNIMLPFILHKIAHY